MTSLDEIQRGSVLAPDTVAASGHELAVELTETLRLAVPIALTQLGQIAMMTTDMVLIGRLGDEAVAAAALAHTVFFISFTFGMGLVSAVAPLAAQAFGARNPRSGRRALRVGLWAALAMSMPMMVLPLFGERILLALGQAPAIADLAQRYLFGLAWGITRALWFPAIRGFMGAVNRPEPGLWITLAAIPANAVLVYLLIHGELGLPRLGLFGAGLASTIVDFGMLLAGHQIALQVTAILFMVPFGIGMAATVRVGHAVGRNDAAAVKRAGFTATLLGIVLVSTLTLAVILGRFAIARFFFGEAAAGAGATIELTATLLMVGATFFVADGIQTVAAGALWGLDDTRGPLLFAPVSYLLM